MTIIATIAINLLLNELAYLYSRPHSATLYAYVIAGTTIVSQLIIIAVLLYLLGQKNRLPTLTKKTLNRDALRDIATMAKTSFVSSIESGFFIATTYVFLTVMAQINVELLTARNFLAPWFRLVGSIGQGGQLMSIEKSALLPLKVTVKPSRPTITIHFGIL